MTEVQSRLQEIAPESVSSPLSLGKGEAQPSGDPDQDAAKIAKKMSGAIDPAIDRLKPILSMIDEVPFHRFPLFPPPWG